MPFGLPDEAIDAICSVFRNHPQIQMAVLYGSRAKGTYKNGSDIDLTLKGDQIDQRTRNRIDDELDDLLLPWMFDLSIYSNIENPDLIAHIDRIGIPIYQRRTNRVADSNSPAAQG
jgi:predicted nucleotidyltransferase